MTIVPYQNWKIYGPYLRKDGRKHVIAVHNLTKKKKTISFPKYLVECHIKRYLKKDETIDHIDGDFNNNCLENLKVLNRSEHAKQDVLRLKPQYFICEVCKKEFKLKGTKLHDAYHARKSNKKGPFCSKKCAGFASHNIEKYSKHKIIRELTTLKSLNRETH